MVNKLDLTCKALLPLFLPVFVLDLLFSLISLGYIIIFGDGGNPTTFSAKVVITDKNCGMQSVAVSSSTTSSSHGKPRRSPNVPKDGALVSSFPDAKTIYEMTKNATDKYGDHVAMQHFKFLELKKTKDTDRFPTKHYSNELVKITYNELGKKIQSFGNGLRSIGMDPQQNITNFDTAKGKFTLVIYEDTCKEWSIAMNGALSQSMVVATCYATLGDNAVVSAVNETGATAIMVNWKNTKKFCDLAEQMPTLKTIIASTHESPKDGAKIYRPPNGEKIQVVSFEEVIDMGMESTFEPKPPKPSDVAVIMYTSGSTGKPKGVVMKHSNLVAGLAGMSSNVHLREKEEVYISYLPLAHILALQIDNIVLRNGGTSCYTDPRELPKVMPRFKPTIFAGVPKVWEMLQTGLEKKLSKGPAPLKIIFNILLVWKIWMITMGMDTPVSNMFFGLISSKVFGRRRIEFGVTGGGPMSESLQLFCRAVFNSPIIQGYALTETCVGGCFQTQWDQRPGIVGPPVPCVEIVLQSELDIKDNNGFPYLASDRTGAKGEPVIGRGEICMRGPCISSGYYKLADKTKEDFDEEGFFHTGDIGQFTSDGCIQIVDRKKNLVKLKSGEYVAIEAMESVFVGSPYVSALCVIANGDLDGPLAIAIADNDALTQWARNANISHDSVHALAKTDAARKEVVNSFIEKGKDGGLTKLELRIKDCVLITDDEWKPGHGMTASMKMDRKSILKIHEDQLFAMYKRQGVNIS
mmetsp:Transcript_18709/g.21512  ORF Transcript_18709/g.21512 Transcript_18709/m.21512 type:complete len:750 (+) Transcript_18709:150-2399(+)